MVAQKIRPFVCGGHDCQRLRVGLCSDSDFERDAPWISHAGLTRSELLARPFQISGLISTTYHDFYRNWLRSFSKHILTRWTYLSGRSTQFIPATRSDHDFME